MKRIRAEKLSGKESTREYRYFQPWLDRAAEITREFATTYDDDPFAYNETASVSLLCSAAVSAGYLALAEFIQNKRARFDHRRHVPGRWDLWLATDNWQWGLEFKQLRGRFTPERLASTMQEATACARAIARVETNCRMGVLIASLRSDTPRRDRARTNLRDFAAMVDHAWLIDVEDDDRETYFFFRYVQPR